MRHNALRMERSRESRAEATAAILVAVVLMSVVPDRVANHPRWALDAVAGVLAVVLLLGTRAPAPPRAGWRVAALLLTGVLTVANLAVGTRMVVDLARGRGLDDPAVLLLTGAAIWLTNVIVFALWYWELDRGGPAGRAEAADTRRDPSFLFPQWTLPAPFREEAWQPRFVDYFYVSFTNATAFSPTDAMPLTRWAKLAMMVQAALSIVIVLLVVARAVNILD